MNCGLSAELIEYNNSNDITVRFSNGVVRNKMRYRDFKAGYLEPTAKMIKPNKRDIRVGEMRVMNCGIEAEIIEYNNCNDITVRFSNGVVRTGIMYKHFKLGNVSDKIRKKSSKIDCGLEDGIVGYNTRYITNKHDIRVGEVRKMNCGLNAKIIKYENCYNITVQFSNGVIKTGVTYNNFKRGAISPRIRPVVKR